ncbi:LysE family translocator [Phyllobacterium myrsinacearum]|uniref:LysE family translocator n=1 Tax=Phyllobacterium myrsinacearum TaxID=28101 RepID=UPI00102A7936|nr:LysE family translocator [Phyllobacterium myrsinacearum]
MEIHTLLLFTATVLPLICTPGPDMLFVASQAIAGGRSAGLRATAGVCLGYLVHSTLVALGLAAIVAASPLLFEALRWIGITYLLYLACKLIASALRAGRVTVAARPAKRQLQRGFLTAFLNPKGMMIYFAILPQFIQPGSSIALQAAILSAVFVLWCAVVYVILSLAIGRLAGRGGFNDRRRRMVEGGAGGLLLVAAGLMAAK